MTDITPTTATSGTLEALQRQSSNTRRLRPPDLQMPPGDGSRIPLRAEMDKAHRRESRLGLRSIFGRSRNSPEVEAPAAFVSREAPARSGVRASLADISNWPYGLHAVRSEILLPKHQESLTSVASAAKPPAGRSQTPVPMTKHQKTASTSKRGALATWDPPPLFQAYPQAIKHAHLPACTQSAEALSRQHGKRESISVRDGLTHANTTTNAGEDGAGERLVEKAKKRHRRNTSASSMRLDWTNKIYVLVTSGYVLQYAGEGSFDRLPEKMLQLGKDSAAFASDLIPGRHWVLQVSSVMDSDGGPSQDSKSLFGRFAFRGAEKRHAHNFLMVFENAEDMDSWIATFRREIEALGGKKNLSETGKPKADDNVLELRAQPSQRTLVVRDPERFSRVISPQDVNWDEPVADGPEIHLEKAESETTREHSFDDLSTTNSVVSHDGRQLDGLRDSTNRFSYMSSGQRTVVTSDSSPSCSPTRDSFAGQLDDPSHTEPVPEVRLRPNAAAILDRRQSMQTMNGFLDFKGGAQPGPARPFSTSYQDGSHPHLLSTGPQETPNFSLPHAFNKRQSLVQSPTEDLGRLSSPTSVRAPPARGIRRPPPPSLGFSRPLSIVADQPSPGSTSPPASGDHFIGSDDGNGSEAPDSPSIFSSWGQETGRRPPKIPLSLPARNSSLLPKHGAIQVTVHTSPRKYASMHALRASDSSIELFAGSTELVFPQPRPRSPSMPNITWETPRSQSSLDSHGKRSQSPHTHPSIQVIHKRSSMFAVSSEVPARRSLHDADVRWSQTDRADIARKQNLRRAQSPHGPANPAAQHHLRVSSGSGHVLNRRSMPHLVDGPPPAPPPTCALPPIPRKQHDRSNSRSASIRV
ncbi:Peptidase family M20/M25/M40 protein [Pleurostoma richardsiae]|uniref:Peptidase family M20/M25/M40 protein n=1 Tax=Pleurostoma richardsiae TaxID=41990 RepID=A0AA38VV39_9PEZI|nr:Peptidase family M20/M25/M40 protein [Pleurostoma richardsiae]